MKKRLLSFFMIAALLRAHAAPIIEIDRIIAVINKNVITEQQLDTRVKEAKKSLAAQKISPPPNDVLMRQVLDQMITEEVELQFAASHAITVDDNEIDETIQRLAQQNHLSIAELRNKLVHNGEDYLTFRESIRRELLLSKVRDSEVNSRISVSDTEIEQILKSAQYANRTEYRLANILIDVPERADNAIMDSLTKKVTKVLTLLDQGVSFGELAAAYSDAPNALKGGELEGWRQASSLPADLLALLEKLKPGQHTNALRTQQGFFIFQLQQKRTGKTPMLIEQYRTRHILIRTNELVSDAEAKAKILTIREQLLQNGANFAELAKLHSEDGSREKGGDLGWVSPGNTVVEFERIMVSLPVNTVSEPVRSPFGWHIILVEGRRTEDISKDYERNQIKQQIRARKAEQAFIDWIHQLRDSAYIEDHLEDK